jgi:hypothetical protein
VVTAQRTPRVFAGISRVAFHIPTYDRAIIVEP